MASRGETVKYIIDADTSGFARGMAAAELESGIAGRKIDRNLSRTAKSSENNFRDIRRNAQTAASSIRNFGIAFQAFNTTSAIIGVTALSGAVLELAGAFAAAGSTVSLLLPALAQGAAGIATYKTGVSGLGQAFKAIGKNDGKAFKESLLNLGPAATQVAYAAAGINKAFNGIKLNVQNALFKDMGNTILRLGSSILPTLNVGMQRVAQSMNGVLKEAASLADTPLFRGLLATVFNDTANNISTLTGALAPILNIFTKLYLIASPYVSLLTQGFVNLTVRLSNYLNTAKGQNAFNLSLQYGIIAVQQLGHLVGAVFGLLTSIFRTSVASGTDLIVTLTSIVDRMTAFVNSADGQAKLQSLFNFTSIAVTAVADSIGRALNAFFTIIQVVNSLNPGLQGLIVSFLATSLTVRPLISYLSQLYLAVRLLAITLFNVVEQAIVVFRTLGLMTSVVLILAFGLIYLGAVIRGPLGSALFLVGAITAIYIGLSYLLGIVASGTAVALAAEGEGALIAGGGMTFAARAATVLQSALLPLLILAAGVLIILSMLGLFSGKAKGAQGAATGLGGSLGSLQKSMKGVGGAGKKATGAGINPMSDALDNVANSANAATGSLASFDKMNVLTSNNAGSLGGPNSGIPGVPSLPNFDGASLGAPTIDPSAFDNTLADMQKNFKGLSGLLGKGFPNPFKSIADFLTSHPGLGMLILVGIIGVITALFVVFGFAAIAATIGIGLTIGLIVLAVLAVIAIVILLAKNWDTVWSFIKSVTGDVAQFIMDIFSSVGNFLAGVLLAIGGYFAGLWTKIQTVFAPVISFFTTLFQGAWNAIVFVWNVAVSYFTTLFDNIKIVFTIFTTVLTAGFRLAWEGIKVIWNVAVGFFSGVWNGITAVFSAVAGFFGSVFGGAWTAIKNVFSAVGGFFQGVWNTIVSIFGSVGAAVGNAIGSAFKGALNGVISAAQTILNAPINAINGLISLINKIPGVPDLPRLNTFNLPRLAKGGIVNSPMVAQIGEAGKEAVMPLENNTGWIDMLAAKINSANGNGSQQPINLTVKIGEDKVANKIIDLINEKTQMSGRNQVIV